MNQTDDLASVLAKRPVLNQLLNRINEGSLRSQE